MPQIQAFPKSPLTLPVRSTALECADVSTFR
jgi:hypothetical protein